MVILLHIMSSLSHMEHWWGLTWIIDNVIVDVIVVDNIGHVAPA